MCEVSNATSTRVPESLFSALTAGGLGPRQYRDLCVWPALGRAQPDLVVQQRLHGRLPERSLGLEVLSPDPDLRFQPLRLVGSPQSLLKPVSRG